MNRKDFFKKLGLGAVVVFTAPKLLARQERYTLIREEPEFYIDPSCEDLSSSGISNGWHIKTKDEYADEIMHYYSCRELPITKEQYREWCEDFFHQASEKYAYQLNKAMNEEIWRMKL